MKYKEFIEEYFHVDEAKTGKLIPFRFNKMQEMYYKTLCETYILEDNFAGLREAILKVRRLGFTTFILAMLAAETIMTNDPIRSLEISYKDDATLQHFRRFKMFIESYCAKKNINIKDFVETDNKHELVLKHNRASFYVGTASAKTGERGGTVQNILFSEIAHYPDTEIMTAREIVEASMRMVDIKGGKVFCETTANGVGNYFHNLWLDAKAQKSRFKSRFFGWKDFYSVEEFALIASEFQSESMLKQEYPETDEEAFIFSGEPFFDRDSLIAHRKECYKAPLIGNLTGQRPVMLEKVNL